MEGTFKTSRTKIVMPASSFGPNRSKILEAWKKVRGNNIATMRISYENDGVHLLLYPFNSYEVEYSAEVPKSAQTDVKWIRRLVMPGLIPQTSADDKHLARNTIIENYWIPVKKCRGTTSVLRSCGKWQELTDDERTDLRYVAMFFAKNDGIQTTMEFYIDKRAHRKAEGMEPDRWVAHMLDVAVELLAESLRHVIEEADPHTLTAAATMNELSAAFADELDGLNIV